MTYRALVFATLFATGACAGMPAPAETPRLVPADLAVLAGTGWNGTLTYQDYSPPFGEVSIQAALDVRQTPEGLTFAYIYPKEPQANSESPFLLSADGTMLEGAVITAISRDAEALQVTTTAPCEDNDKPATCTYDYSIAPKAFSVRKSVQFTGEASAFTRNTYRYTRT